MLLKLMAGPIVEFTLHSRCTPVTDATWQVAEATWQHPWNQNIGVQLCEFAVQVCSYTMPGCGFETTVHQQGRRDPAMTLAM